MCEFWHGIGFDLGVVGPYPPGSPEAVEVRAFFPKDGKTAEDPVPGSLKRVPGPVAARLG